MYKIKNFKVGDKIYKHTKQGWKLCGDIVTVTDGCYGMRSDSVVGIIVTTKGLFESIGYIGRSQWSGESVLSSDHKNRGKG
jgi:hypothetical protein|tara:strand:- start:178 stop:420 length:243 start_codon:yes stop_codon:yes gene_type:complete